MTFVKTIGALVVLALVLYVVVTLIGVLAASAATLFYMVVLAIVGTTLYHYLKGRWRRHP